ncbi:hypothetical protein HQ571_05455 [Candidatus Kuenenbacteria bacterium]|nr:hypothetical protein [Candidatus Kuenenbacteria bacterium]
MSNESGPAMPQEPNHELVKEKLSTYFNKMLADLDEPRITYIHGKEDYKAMTEAYLQLLEQKKYFKAPEYECEVEGQTQQNRQTKSLHTFLTGALNKYQAVLEYIKIQEDKEILPELKRKYEERIDQIEPSLAEMKKDPEWPQFIAKQDEKQGEKEKI